MKNLIICLILTGFTTIGFTQDKSNEFDVLFEEVDVAEVVLEEVEEVGVNYKYLNAIGYRGAAEPVKMLAQKVASFDFKNSIKNDKEDIDYHVSFENPHGEILAVFDNEGEIIKTTEKFNDISLPLVVSNAIVEKYPGWRITGDNYMVTYVKDGELNKTYKLYIEKTNVGKRVINTDENGNFLDYKISVL